MNVRQLVNYLPVTRAEHARVLAERDEWQLRAEVAAAAHQNLLTRLEALEDTVKPKTRRKLRRALAAVPVALWALVIGVMIGGTAIPHHNDHPTLASPTFTEPVNKPQTVKMSPPQNYSWMPVRKAEGYQIAFFRDNKEVFTTQTTRASATVTLAPGMYRWLVWPVFKAGRSAQATVSSLVSVE